LAALAGAAATAAAAATIIVLARSFDLTILYLIMFESYI
jgi:hypothetical protein